MSDSEKVKLIQILISNAWESVPTSEECGFWKGVLMGIETVVNGEEDD